MATIYFGATLTPHFDQFLPGWVARQPWYAGGGAPELTPVGFFRFEDPAGQVGMETHLRTDGTHLYQIPMTYRDAPLPGAQHALITTTEHSVLGTRWMYDAPADPVWVAEVLRLVRIEGISEDSPKTRVGPAQARGELLTTGELAWETVTIELDRVLTPGVPAEAGLAGRVLGSWCPGGEHTPPVTGTLARLR